MSGGSVQRKYPTNLAIGWWDEWRGGFDSVPTMLIKRLVKIPFWRKRGKWLSFRIDLHKFVGIDAPGCFHNHPAWALRIPLWNGYHEEVYPVTQPPTIKWIRPLFGASIISPSFAHRVMGLARGSAYSLWLRGPICSDTKLLGDGWPAYARNRDDYVCLLCGYRLGFYDSKWIRDEGAICNDHQVSGVDSAEWRKKWSYYTDG